MPVYLLTNRVTHARAVVVASDEREAVSMHPTDDMAHRRAKGWGRYRLRSPGSLLGGEVLVEVPPPAGWPVDLSLVDATLLARYEDRGAPHGPQAYQADMQLRQGPPGQEGPDSTWGGYTLDDLRHHGPHGNKYKSC